MKIQKYINVLCLAAAFAALGIVGWQAFAKEDSTVVRYVRSADLLYGYEGMKEAQQELAEKEVEWNSNLDDLKEEYDATMAEGKGGQGAMSEEEFEEWRRQAIGKQQNLQQYAAIVKSKSEQEERELMEGVLNQVNSFVAQYSKDKGYSLVVGTTNDGAVLYGDDALDITDELLEALNANYRGQ